MNYQVAPLTDVENPTIPMGMLGALSRGYARLFAESRYAERISPPHIVHNTGFELSLMVSSASEIADGVRMLTLVRPDLSPLPRWSPGAHIDVFTPSGKQRHYSLTGDPADVSSYRIAVRKLPDGTGSVEMHDVRIGEFLSIRGPRNAFTFAASPSYLFVAGGIGITPILPMVRAAQLDGADWTLVYTGANRASMPFLDELLEIESRSGRGRLDIRPDEECGVPDLAQVLADRPEGAAVYVCGPTGMLDGLRDLVYRDHPQVEMHSERFSAPPVVGGAQFDVLLARSGTRVTVGADETALTAIRRVKPEVQYSCQQGFCGACRVKVLKGEVEHRDRVLVGDQRDTSMTICVSRACDDELVIDL